MRHRKRTCKLGRTTSHRERMFSNMLKSLVVNGRIQTTVAKAKHLKRSADKLITLAKSENADHAKRRVSALLKLRYNRLTAQQRKAAKEGNFSSYNDDRKVLGILFDTLKQRFDGRMGGYTRIIKTANRVGDDAPLCVIEYIPE